MPCGPPLSPPDEGVGSILAANANGGVATLPVACLASQDSSSSSVVLPALGVGNIRAAVLKSVPLILCPFLLITLCLSALIAPSDLLPRIPASGVGQFPIISDRYPVFRFVAALDGRILLRTNESPAQGVGNRPTKSGRLTECMESSDC